MQEDAHKTSQQEQAHIYIGAPERVLDYYETNLKIRRTTGAEIMGLWAPNYAPVRKSERFKAYVRSMGMADYWRVRGWPDLCHPTTGDDFACN